MILFGIIRLFVWSELRTIQLEVELVEVMLELEVFNITVSNEGEGP